MTFSFEEADDDVMLKPPRRAVVPRDVLIDTDEERRLQNLTHGVIEIAEAEEEELEQERESRMTRLNAFFERVWRGAIRLIAKGKRPFMSGACADWCSLCSAFIR
jgi:hypothetical protein